MADEKLIRLANFRAFCRGRGLTPSRLAEDLGSRVSYWSDLLGGKKSFGEKIARRIEDHYQIGRGGLDEDKPREQTMKAAPKVDWPFDTYITPERWAALNPQQRAVVEWAAYEALQRVESAHPASSSRKRAAQ